MVLGCGGGETFYNLQLNLGLLVNGTLTCDLHIGFFLYNFPLSDLGEVGMLDGPLVR